MSAAPVCASAVSGNFAPGNTEDSDIDETERLLNEKPQSCVIAMHAKHP